MEAIRAATLAVNMGSAEAMAVKMVAMGVHCGHGSYWDNSWAIFEGFIVFISWTPFLPIPSMPHALSSSLRACRALPASHVRALASRAASSLVTTAHSAKVETSSTRR